MKTIFTLLLAVCTFASVSAQNCGLYYDLKPGGQYELTTYDSKQQPTGRIRQQIKDVSTSGGVTRATLHQQTLDKKDKVVTEGDFMAECQAGLVRLDMRSMLGPDQMRAYKDMDVKATGDFLELPAAPKAGSSLKDGTMNVDISDRKSGTRVANMRLQVTSRKVEAVNEAVTTPAGKFSCVKVSQDMRMETGIGAMMIPVSVRTVEWYAPGVGTVRSETYRKDKLLGYSLLTVKP